MSDVHDWDPAAHALGQAEGELLNRIASKITDNTLHLTSSQLASLRSIYPTNAHIWSEFSVNRTNEELVNWIKVFTLCPEQHSGFTDAERSPVITLVRVLRKRGSYPESLTSWIKQHSTNRFLPYGSLTDRLR